MPPLDYNLLLGRSWNYAMSTIASAVPRVVVFLHEGNLVTVDQLNFTRKGHMETNESIVPLVDQVKLASERLGVGMYSLLMGTFDVRLAGDADIPINPLPREGIFS